MVEEEVHGRAEPEAGLDDQDHDQVPQHSDCVDGQEDQEQELRTFREAQESESDLSTLVCLVPVDKMSVLIQIKN